MTKRAMKPLPNRIWLLMLGVIVAIVIGTAAYLTRDTNEKPEAKDGQTPKRTGLNITPSTLLDGLAHRAIQPASQRLRGSAR